MTLQLKQHPSQNQLLDSLQSADGEHLSTETTLMKVQSDVTCALNNNSIAILVLLDLSGFFDTTNHTILLRRLQHSFGVKGQALDWFHAYLVDRTQSVSVKGATPKPCVLGYRVPSYMF